MTKINKTKKKGIDMATLGLSSKKNAKSGKSHKAKSGSQDDAQAFLEELEKKKQASPDTCVFC